MCDPHLRLARLLGDRAGPAARLIETSADPWTSLTFDGMRHRLVFTMPRTAAVRLARVSAEELAIPGHLLAAFSLSERPTRDGMRIECAALTVVKA